MASLSDIEWTDATWNPVAGCLAVSPGCTNCYAMRMAARLEAMGCSKYFGTTRKSGKRAVWTGKIAFDNAALNAPLGWKKPRKIFVNSMSDLFQDAVPVAFISKVWAVMQAANWHIFQILTKRPARMAQVLQESKLPVLPNVWLGTSVESADQAFRLDHLKGTPATVRFVSFEPLIGSVGEINLSDIHWAIVGGESGPGARAMDKAWVHEIQSVCTRDNVAFFFKQWGGNNKKTTGRKLSGRTWDNFPMQAAGLLGSNANAASRRNPQTAAKAG